MKCPMCSVHMHNNIQCDNCGFDFSKSSWVIVTKVAPPDDIIIESLLKSFDIPVKLIRESIASVYNLSVGPLGEVHVAVPEVLAENARKLLQAKPLE